MKVLIVIVTSVVPSISAFGMPFDMASCAIDVAIEDRKMRPTSCTCREDSDARR